MHIEEVTKVIQETKRFNVQIYHLDQMLYFSSLFESHTVHAILVKALKFLRAAQMQLET